MSREIVQRNEEVIKRKTKKQVRGSRRWESNVEEALMEMYLAGVFEHRIEDTTEALWGSKVSPP